MATVWLVGWLLVSALSRISEKERVLDKKFNSVFGKKKYSSVAKKSPAADFIFSRRKAENNFEPKTFKLKQTQTLSSQKVMGYYPRASKDVSS